MKASKKTKGTKNRKLLLVVSILLIAGALGFWTYSANGNGKDTTRPMNDVDYSEATDEEKQAVEDHKQEVAKNQEKEDQSSSGANSISLTITRARQAGAGQPLNIRTLISGTTGGTCQVTLTKNGQPTIAKQFAVAFEATSARCVSADVPVSEFTVGGEWKLQVVVKDGQQQSSAAETTVEITK